MQTPNNDSGIYLTISSNNTLTGNNASNNNNNGLSLDFSTNNTLIGNNAWNNIMVFFVVFQQ